jgi:hypothetical protein
LGVALFSSSAAGCVCLDRRSWTRKPALLFSADTIAEQVVATVGKMRMMGCWPNTGDHLERRFYPLPPILDYEPDLESDGDAADGAALFAFG